MHILISAQDHLHRKGGIGKFIRTYASKTEHSTRFLTRKNILKPHELDGTEVESGKHVLDQGNPDIIHIHSALDTANYGGFIDSWHQVPIIYFCHSLIEDEIAFNKCSNDMHISKMNSQHDIFRRADKIIFFNTGQMERAILRTSSIEGKCEVILHGTHKRENIPATRGNVILYSGRISAEKGLIVLAKAFKGMEKDQARLVIVGDISTPYTKEIKIILEDTDHELKEWIEDEKDLDELYQEAKVVVLPSHFDSFNMSGIEALANGARLVVSDIPAFHEIYIEKGHARAFISGDPDSLRTALTLAINDHTPHQAVNPYPIEDTIKKIEQINYQVMIKRKEL